MTTVVERNDWDAGIARRTRTLGGGEITAILALAGATDVITFSGGFPDPATFPTGVLAEIAARLITSDPGVTLQYSATEGLASVRDFVSGRLASLEGRAPGAGELMITSGGIDCMELVAKTLPGSWRPRRRRGADVPRRHHGVPRLRGRGARRARRCAGTARRHAGRSASPLGMAAEDPLHDPGLPESERADDEPGPAAGACRACPAVRLPDPGGRRLPRTRISSTLRRRACGRWPRTWCCRPGRSPRFSRPGSGWAGRLARPRSSPGWSWPSRTQTSARARSASGCWRSTGAAGTWSSRSSPSRALYARRAALTGQALDRAYARGHDVDDAARRLLYLGHRAGWRGHRGPVRQAPAPGRWRTCRDGRSTRAMTGTRS